MATVDGVQPRAMRDTFLQSLYEAMREDGDIFLVSADFGSPVLDSIRAEVPDRFINVGIAEQNLINVSTGLALEGFTVFAYAIAPFITMRCFEQIRVNLALLSTIRAMNVNLIGVGAGYSYVVSGPTHQCYEDITLMRAMPTMRVLSLSDQLAAAAAANYCIANPGPKYLRMDAQVLPPLYTHAPPSLSRGFDTLKPGGDGDLCLLATGYMTHTALEVAAALAARDVQAAVVDLHQLSHFDEEEFNQLLSAYRKVVTLEEGFAGRGGLDAMVLNHNNQHQLGLRILTVGVQGGYRFEIGGRRELHEQVGIGVSSVVRRILEAFGP